MDFLLNGITIFLKAQTFIGRIFFQTYDFKTMHNMVTAIFLVSFFILHFEIKQTKLFQLRFLYTETPTSLFSYLSTVLKARDTLWAYF